MVVITGSVIPTVSIASGDRALFTVDGLGEVAMEVVLNVLPPRKGRGPCSAARSRILLSASSRFSIHAPLSAHYA